MATTHIKRASNLIGYSTWTGQQLASWTAAANVRNASFIFFDLRVLIKVVIYFQMPRIDLPENRLADVFHGLARWQRNTANTGKPQQKTCTLYSGIAKMGGWV